MIKWQKQLILIIYIDSLFKGTNDLSSPPPKTRKKGMNRN